MASNVDIFDRQSLSETASVAGSQKSVCSLPPRTRIQMKPRRSSVNHNFNEIKTHYKTRDLIDIEREIFMINMKNSRKNTDIQSMTQQRKREKHHLKDSLEEIAQKKRHYQQFHAGMENTLFRAFDKQKEQTKETMAKRTEKQKLSKDVAILKRDIRINEEQFQKLMVYENFLKNVCPNGMKYYEFFTSGDVLLQCLDDIAEETLFLKHLINALEGIEDTSIEDDLTQMKSYVDEVQSKIPKIPPLVSFPEVQQEVEEIDVFKNMVINTYYQCFQTENELPTLQKLLKIENELEEFYKICDKRNVQEIHMMQKQIDKERREQMRIRKMIESAQIQQNRLEQCLQRASLPVRSKKHYRPLITRILPLRIEKVVDQSDLLAKELEQQYLYGPISY